MVCCVGSQARRTTVGFRIGAFMKNIVLIYTIPWQGFSLYFPFYCCNGSIVFTFQIESNSLNSQRKKLSFQSFHRTPKSGVLVFCFSVLLLYRIVDALKAFRNLMYTNLFSLKFYNVKLKKSISSQGLSLFIWTE